MQGDDYVSLYWQNLRYNAYSDNAGDGARFLYDYTAVPIGNIRGYAGGTIGELYNVVDGLATSTGKVLGDGVNLIQESASSSANFLTGTLFGLLLIGILALFALGYVLNAKNTGTLVKGLVP